MVLSGFYVCDTLTPNWLWTLRKENTGAWHISELSASGHFPDLSTESGAQRESRSPAGGRNKRLTFEAAGAAGICGAGYRRVGRGTEQENQDLRRGFIESLTGYRAGYVQSENLCCLTENSSWHSASQTEVLEVTWCCKIVESDRPEWRDLPEQLGHSAETQGRPDIKD